MSEFLHLGVRFSLAACRPFSKHNTPKLHAAKIHVLENARSRSRGLLIGKTNLVDSVSFASCFIAQSQ